MESLIPSLRWIGSLAVVILASASLRIIRRHKRNPRNLPYPPGPKGYPVIGNLLEIPGPQVEGWLTYDKWKKEYGDIVYLNAVGQGFVVLGSLNRVNDIMETRAHKYSGRMQTTMVQDMMGWAWSFIAMTYTPTWKKDRRTFLHYFSTSAVHNYRDIQMDEAAALALRLIENADDLMGNIRRTFAGTIMRICYGTKITSNDDSYITTAEIAMSGVAEAGIPGSFWVDFIPALKHIPSWFPGATFKRKARYWYEVTQMIRRGPFNLVKKKMDEGTAVSCVASSLIDALPPPSDPAYPVEVEAAISIPASAYTTGADTTVSSVHAFFLAMAMHPEVMTKAQAEIDGVVGRERLPTFDDLSSLPYVQAVCKEILRWHMVTPLGVPHISTEDDEYDGYFIPKGTVIIANGWSILHDPGVFENPMDFNPDRYIKDGKINHRILDPYTSGAFGFGRRVCAGRSLAKASLYSIVSTVLAVCDIRPPLDNQGNRHKLSYGVSTGLMSYPKPFKVEISPRSSGAERLARARTLED